MIDNEERGLKRREARLTAELDSRKSASERQADYARGVGEREDEAPVGDQYLSPTEQQVRQALRRAAN